MTIPTLPTKTDLNGNPTAGTYKIALGQFYDYVAGIVASMVPFTATGNISSTNVQAAIEELDTEKIQTPTNIAQGDIIYRGASGFERLPAGTSGQVLKTNGESANPAWVEAPGNPVGTYIESASPTAPTGYLECIGGVASRITYANLFSLIGTTYGVGDGSTTFKLPDRRDRFALAKGTTYATIGATGGETTHVLTIAEMPNHSHTVPSAGVVAGSGISTGEQLGATASRTTSAIGGGTAHNNMPPYFVVNYYIKY